jgi:hypothetical protein
MDIYLPADFHELHAAAADDWRDISTSRNSNERTALHDPVRDLRPADAMNGCADPSWWVF